MCALVVEIMLGKWISHFLIPVYPPALRGRLPHPTNLPRGRQISPAIVFVFPITPNSESLHANFNNHCGFFSDFELKKLLCSLNISKSIQVLSTVIIVWHVIVQFTFYDYFRFWLKSVTYLVMHRPYKKISESLKHLDFTL